MDPLTNRTAPWEEDTRLIELVTSWRDSLASHGFGPGGHGPNVPWV